MGAYAIQPDDYDVLTPYLDACIRKYHGVPAGAKHVNNWDYKGVEVSMARLCPAPQSNARFLSVSICDEHALRSVRASPPTVSLT